MPTIDQARRRVREGRDAPSLTRHVRWFPTIVFTLTTAVFLFLPLVGQRTFAPVDLLELGSPYRDAIGRVPDVRSPIQGDIIEDHLPSQISFFEDLKGGEYQLWQPLTAAGIPRGVWPTSFGYLSPFNIAYLVAPDWYAPGLRTALVFLFVQWTMYLFLRRLGTGVVAATLGGLAYAFSGTSLVFMLRITAPMLLPAMLWATDRLVCKPSICRSLPVAGLVAWAWFEGFPFAFFTVTGVAALWGVWVSLRDEELSGRCRDRLIRIGVWLGGAFASGLLLSAVQFLPFAADIRSRGILEHRRYTAETHLPTMQYLGLVDERLLGRSQLEYWSGGNPYESSVQSGAIVLAGALAGLAAAAAGRFLLTRRQRAAWSLFAASTAVVAVMTWVGTPLLGAFYKLPFLGNNPFTRGRFLVNFGLAVIAALVFDTLAYPRRELADQTRGSAPSRAVSAVSFVALVGIGLAALVPWFRAADEAGDLRRTAVVLTVAALSVVVAAILALVVWKRPSTPAALAAVMALTTVVFVQLAFPYRSFVPAAPRSDFYTRQAGHDAIAALIGDDHRLTASGLQTYPPGANIVLGLPDVRGTALRSRELANLLEAINPEVYARDPLKPILLGEAWNLDSPLLDDLAVGAYGMDTLETPLGQVSTVDSGWQRWTDSTDPSLSPARLSAPGPIQGVFLPLLGKGDCTKARLEVEVSTPEGTVDVITRPAYDMSANWLPFGIVGDKLRKGEEVALVVRSSSPECRVEVGTIEDARSGVRPALQWILPEKGQTYRLAATEQGWIYERPTAWNFVSAHSRWKAFENQRSLLDYAASRPAGDRDVASYLAADPGAEPIPTPNAAGGKIRDVRTDGNTWHFRVDGEAMNLVVVSETYADGWKAQLDGRPAEIVPVDGALMGVFVPPGEHEVTLSYMPKSFVMGMIVSAAAALALIAACAAERLVQLRRRQGSSTPGTS